MIRLLIALCVLFLASFSSAAEPENSAGTNSPGAASIELAVSDVALDFGKYLKLPFKAESDTGHSERFARSNHLGTPPPPFSPAALNGRVVDPDSFEGLKKRAPAKLQGPVPESSTMLLLGLGLLGLSGYGARKKFKR